MESKTKSKEKKPVKEKQLPEVIVEPDFTVMERRAKEKKPTPLEIMLEVMDEQFYTGSRLTAVSIAEKCAPYFHPKLTATTISGDDNKPPVQITYKTAEQLKALVRGTE